MGSYTTFPELADPLVLKGGSFHLIYTVRFVEGDFYDS